MTDNHAENTQPQHPAQNPEGDPLAPTPVGETAGNDSAAPATDGTDRVAALEAEIVRLKDHILRALAEADNTRKRAVKEREDATKFAVTGFARDMLEMADNFRRAIDSIPEELKTGSDPMIANLMAGIEAMERNLLKTFEKHGIKKIEPIGVPFDPHFHEVMFEAPVPGKAPGTVIQLLEAGYVLNDRLLRPARVGVARADGPESGGSVHKLDESV